MLRIYCLQLFKFAEASAPRHLRIYAFYREKPTTYRETFDKNRLRIYNKDKKGGADMGFRVRIDINPDCDEEIIIRCKNISEEVLRLESLVSNSEMELELGGKLHFIKTDSILFFETCGNKTAAHTRDMMYYTDMKLYELEESLPRSFMRISKSCILNTKAVSSIRREFTGICEAFFAGTVKKVYISRTYYKPFREKINETRLK